MTTDPAPRDKDLTFIVVGAGPTGVEAAPAVLGPFDEKLQSYPALYSSG